MGKYWGTERERENTVCKENGGILRIELIIGGGQDVKPLHKLKGRNPSHQGSTCWKCPNGEPTDTKMLRLQIKLFCHKTKNHNYDNVCLRMRQRVSFVGQHSTTINSTCGQTAKNPSLLFDIHFVLFPFVFGPATVRVPLLLGPPP